MNTYKRLNKQVFTWNEFSIVPIRFEDRLAIMNWRNEQIFHLRQNKILSEIDQNNYFTQVVAKLFDIDQPTQVLFSFLKNDICIGYGGLVHINWIDQHAEISFIMDTQLEKLHFQDYWGIYLQLIQQVAFEELRLHKIFTYAFDLRPHLYKAIEKVGFQQEARLKEHCFFNNEYKDVVIHTKKKQDYFQLKDAKLEDAKLLFEWTNDPLVRANSFQTESISWENHLQWFTEKLNSDSFIYILSTPSEKVGVIRFDKTENNFILNYSISKAFRGKGLGKLIIDFGIKKLINESIEKHPVFAFVKADNEASLSVFRKLNFIEELTDSAYLFKYNI